MKLFQCCLCTVFAMSAHAQTLQMTNHFGEDLAVTVTQGREFLPSFDKQFTIPAGESSLTTVLRSGWECDTRPYNPSAYLLINGIQSETVNAFLGTGLMCD